MVDFAVRNAERLARWYNAKGFRAQWLVAPEQVREAYFKLADELQRAKELVSKAYGPDAL